MCKNGFWVTDQILYISSTEEWGPGKYSTQTINVIGGALTIFDAEVFMYGDLILSNSSLTLNRTILTIYSSLKVLNNSVPLTLENSSILLTGCAYLRGHLVLYVNANDLQNGTKVMTYNCLNGTFETISSISNIPCSNVQAQPTYSNKVLLVSFTLDSRDCNKVSIDSTHNNTGAVVGVIVACLCLIAIAIAVYLNYEKLKLTTKTWLFELQKNKKV